MRATTSGNIRVGIFVLAGLIVATIVVFTIGSRRGVFDSSVTYYAYFSEVGGLRPGSTVRMSGVRVGHVNSIEIMDQGPERGECAPERLIATEDEPADDESDLRLIRVEFDIVEDAARHLTRGRVCPNPGGEPDPRRICGRAVAQIVGKGMLGDKLLQIVAGTAGEPLTADACVPSEEPADLMTQLGQAGDTIQQAQETIENLNRATQTLADDDFRRSVQQIANELGTFSASLNNPDGTVHRLMTDPELAENVSLTMRNLQTASANFATASRDITGITNEVRHGNGSLHGIIYGQQGNRLVSNAGDAASELARALREVREGEGTLHQLIYEDDADNLIANLTSASEDIAQVTADMRAGRGTIGGLLVDPSIYEDVKRLVGDLERNEILRALVRYSIRRDEAAAPAPEPRPREEESSRP